MRNGRRSVVVVALVATLAALVVSTALAAPGGNGGGKGKGNGKGGTTATGEGTIELVLLNSTDGYAHYGQQITFTVSTTATAYPWVTVKCGQNGVMVYKQSNAIFETSLNQVFTLGPTPLWTGGEANCQAALEDWDAYSKNGSITTLKTLDFQAYA